MSTQIGNQFGSSGKTRARRRTAPQAEATAAAVENTYTTKSDQSKHSQCSKSGMHRLSSNRLKRQFLAQCPHTKKVAATSSCRAAALFVAIVMILTNFNNLIISRQQPLLCQAAVVRPTVFSDLNTSQQQQDNNAVQKQQQQQAAQTPASSPSQVPNQQTQQSQQSNLNTLSAAALASGAVAATSADASQTVQREQQHPTTKISPLKSRFCYSSASSQQQQQQRADQPLGLQSFAIDELAISASSSSNEQVKPNLARLNLDIRGGAWCPANPVHAGNFGKEWIQVKLNRSHVITAIETQGRFGMGNGKEFVPSYQIEYSRNGGRTWHKWKDIRGSNLLRANEDPNSAVKNELSPPIVGANVIRILPYSSVPRTVCMRLELHGCLFDEGAPIAYATQDGVVEPRWGHLIDYTYDGLRMPASGELSHGLGQLVDGVKGPDNFSFNNGFEWVGWKSMNGDVVIEFTFRTVRNFTGALFHSNNLFSSGVEVFQAVDVHYGIDIPYSMETLKDSLHEQQRRQQVAKQQSSSVNSGVVGGGNEQVMKHTLWSQDVLSIEYEPDKKSESSRPVTVHLKQRLANKLKFVLKFASKWILVSEVEFLSHPVELLSLASLSQTHSPPLMAHLQPAKSYDEYVAILREHQLRRLAAETLIFHSTLSPELASQSASPAAPDSYDQPQTPGESSTVAGSLLDDPSTVIQMTAPATMLQTTNKRLQWPPPQLLMPPDFTLKPASNPQLSNNFFNPALYPEPPLLEAAFGGNTKSQQQQKSPAATPDSLSSAPIGLTTVISFVLVLVILLLGLLFFISSYRMRLHQPTSKLGRHLAAGGQVSAMAVGKQVGGAANNLMGPSLHNFMSVFSSPATASSVGASGSRHQRQNGGETGQDHHLYNAIFDSHTTQRRHHNQPTSALRRLATLGHSSSNNKSAHPLLMGGGGQSPGSNGTTNQLLVSVKDASSSSSSSGVGVGVGTSGGLFGSSKPQGINTQLIIGLNQSPHMNNNSTIYNNNQQQNYATHYSTSMSMASSSTNGGQQGDYGDYAIPDAVPIIPPNHPHQHQQHYQHQQMLQYQQQQQPFVSRLTQNGQQVRSSLINQHHNHQQQQVQQHNYEPV